MFDDEPRRVNPYQYRGGGTHKRFITYQEIARFLGLAESRVRQAVSRGKLDPESLDSIVRFKAGMGS